MKEINYLKDGGKISLVAPSFGCTTEPYKTRLQVAINNFKKLGYEVDEGPNIFLAKHKARSNSAKKCAKEFMDAYLSDSDWVIAVGGGQIMCDILTCIDFKKLKKATLIRGSRKLKAIRCNSKVTENVLSCQTKNLPL